MRRIIKPIRSKLLPAKLYLNDLERIIDILKEHTTDINISSYDFIVEDIQQLRNLETEQDHFLQIHCPEIDVILTFNPNGIEFYSGNDSAINSGIILKIQEIVKKRNVFGGGFLVSSWPYVIILGILIVLLVIYSLNVSYFSWIFAGTIIIIITALVLLVNFISKSYSTIRFMNKREERTFWRRNKDRIIVGIITAVVSGFISSLITLLIT